MNHETTFANQSLPPGMFLLKTMFREPSSVRLLAFCTFLLIYIIAFVGNFMLIVLIVWEKQLHKPVYIFLANLAATDLMGTSAALPRVMYNILINNSITFPACFTQMLFLANIVNVNVIMISYFLSLVQVILLLRLHFICKPNVLPNAICINLAIANLACEDVTINNLYGSVFIVMMFGTLTVVAIFTYSFILRECLRGGSHSEKSKKALQTCLTHFMVLCFFLVSVLFIAISLRTANSKHISPFVRVVLDSVSYVLPPISNPIIYGLRMSKIRHTIRHTVAQLALYSAVLALQLLTHRWNRVAQALTLYTRKRPIKAA
uniref:G-protein coupled receptors family 1 profile domain-containing protein n=1 Tax=Eptatretus burgeri TaxID=7764 RepID=A0A8C4R5U0_EPTBU